MINKCDHQTEWLAECTISGSINFTDDVREAKMRFINKQISTISDFPSIRHSANLIIHPSSCLSFHTSLSLYSTENTEKYNEAINYKNLLPNVMFIILFFTNSLTRVVLFWHFSLSLLRDSVTHPCLLTLHSITFLLIKQATVVSCLSDSSLVSQARNSNLDVFIKLKLMRRFWSVF